MEDKISLFVSEDDLNFSLALSINEKLTTLEPLEGVKYMANFLKRYSEYDMDKEVVVYNSDTAPYVVSIACKLDLPVVSITDLIIKNYLTDLLPDDLINADRSANYLGIKDKSDNQAVLTAQMYSKIKTDRERYLPKTLQHTKIHK